MKTFLIIKLQEKYINHDWILYKPDYTEHPEEATQFPNESTANNYIDKYHLTNAEIKTAIEKVEILD